MVSKKVLWPKRKSKRMTMPVVDLKVTSQDKPIACPNCEEKIPANKKYWELKDQVFCCDLCLWTRLP